MPYAGDGSVLSSKNRELAQQHMGPAERIEFCIVGNSDQAIVALGERLLVLKSGLMDSATFGSRVTSFRYRDIASITVNKKWLSGVISVEASGHKAGKPTGVRDQGKDDPYILPNCIVFVAPRIKEYEPYLERLRAKIEEAKATQQRAAATPPAGAFIGELQRLAALRGAGQLSEDDFQQAKRQLLGL